MKKSLSNIIFWFLLVLVAFMPLQAFLGQILSFQTNLSAGTVFWLQHWYEPVTVLIALMIAVLCLVEGRGKKFKLLLYRDPVSHCSNTIKIICLALIILGAISIGLISADVGRGLEGFRFTLFPLLLLLVSMAPNFVEGQKRVLIGTYLLLASLLAGWAIIERLLAADYLKSWGVIAPSAQFGYGFFKVTETLQSTSLLNGPNQLAAYLLPAAFVLITNVSKASTKRGRPLHYLSIILIIVAVLLTFSRSAAAGLVVGLFIFAIAKTSRRWLDLGLIFTSIAILIAVWYYADARGERAILDLYSHGASQQGHEIALRLSLTEMGDRLQEPGRLVFGSGLGTAGPLVIKYGQGIISESWYAQIVLELGLLGLIGWLILVYALVKQNWINNPGLSLALIAISTAALFLHTWADNPAMSITMFTLLGMSGINGKIDERLNTKH